MENVSAKQPSKIRKRKTKKHLDDLRKRAKTSQQPRKPPTVNAGVKKILDFNKKNSDSSKITKDRLTMKHGLFAKGVRTETFSRVGVSEEVLARMNGNLHKIIDLANGKPHMQEVASASPETEKPSQNMENQSDIESDHPLTFTPQKTNNNAKVIAEKNISKSQPDDNFNINSLNVDYHKIYKDFNSCIPSVLCKYWPSFMKMDIESDTRNNLRNLARETIVCSENASRNELKIVSPHIENILQDTMENSVLLNPIQYLKQIQKKNVNLHPSCHITYTTRHVSHPTASRSSDASPSGTFENINDKISEDYEANDTEYNNSESTVDSDEIDSHILNSHNVDDLIQESPEQVFYPRRMNLDC